MISQHTRQEDMILPAAASNPIPSVSPLQLVQERGKKQARAAKTSDCDKIGMGTVLCLQNLRHLTNKPWPTSVQCSHTRTFVQYIQSGTTVWGTMYLPTARSIPVYFFDRHPMVTVTAVPIVRSYYRAISPHPRPPVQNMHARLPSYPQTPASETDGLT